MIVRAYSWSCITYHTEETIKKFISKDIISKYAYIYHDQEESENHYHLVMVFKQNVSLHYIQSNLDILGENHQNTFGEKLIDRIGIFEYFTHKNEENKVKYDDNLIITNDRKYFSGEIEYKDNVSYQILCDIIAKRPYRELARNYGREVILNYNKYLEFAILIQSQENSHKVVDVCHQEELPF